MLFENRIKVVLMSSVSIPAPVFRLYLQETLSRSRRLRGLRFVVKCVIVVPVPAPCFLLPAPIFRLYLQETFSRSCRLRGLHFFVVKCVIVVPVPAPCFLLPAPLLHQCPSAVLYLTVFGKFGRICCGHGTVAVPIEPLLQQQLLFAKPFDFIAKSSRPFEFEAGGGFLHFFLDSLDVFLGGDKSARLIERSLRFEQKFGLRRL